MEKEKILAQKIKDFNQLMGEISREISDIVMEGKESDFHDILLEMVTSLHNAQKVVRKAYNIFLIKKEKRN